jgi:hypothetical protein
MFRIRLEGLRRINEHRPILTHVNSTALGMSQGFVAISGGILRAVILVIKHILERYEQIRLISVEKAGLGFELCTSVLSVQSSIRSFGAFLSVTTQV